MTINLGKCLLFLINEMSCRSAVQKQHLPTTNDSVPISLMDCVLKLKEQETVCQVKIGTPENGHPGFPFSRKYRHSDAYIYVNMGTPMPIFTVNMGIPL